jgi:hypothetical protein
MPCDLKKYNKCNSEEIVTIESLDWACPIVARACQKSVQHEHHICMDCLEFVNTSLDNLKKR